MEKTIADLSQMDAAGREEWFLQELEQDPAPVDHLLEAAAGLHKQGFEHQAIELADLMRDTLAEREMFRDAIRVFALRMSWEGASTANRDVCKAKVDAWLGQNRDHKILIEHCAFDKPLPGGECLRRLAVLMSLEPNVLCFDKTWGFGIVQRLDTFYKRVEIHFKRKRGHEMSFAYAAETLDLIDDSHLMARYHHEPDVIKEMVAKNPADIVKQALRSYGPLNVAALQEALDPELVTASQWKRFWDGARKVLKQDPLVEIPSRRSDPILLLDKAMAYDTGWFAKLAKERNMKTILAKVEEVLTEEEGDSLDDAAREIVRNRLAFVIKGAEGRDQGSVACALMQAHELAIDIETLNAAEHMQAFYEPVAFLDAARQLSAREFKDFVEYLATHANEKTLDLLLDLIPRLPLGPLQEVIDALIRLDNESECAAAVKSLLDIKQAPVDVLSWIARNLDKVEVWSLGSLPVLVNDMLTILEQGHSGDQLRGHNQLAGQFEDRDWLRTMLGAMTDIQRRSFLGRMRETPAFPEMDRRSVLGRIIKLFPELEQEMVSRSAPREEVPRPTGRFTSARSHRERQLQLEKLVREDIPKNSKEIGVARSYGDLRENHEFKAAKEMQTILLRREAELQQMLSEVMPTDFSGFPIDQAGMGTGVRIVFADGHSESYYILGEWDRDETLGIISSTTRMAQALDGFKTGDDVTVPTEHGESAAVLEGVFDLSDEIRAWVRTEQGPGDEVEPS